MQFQVISVNAKLMTRENTYKVTADFVKFSVSGSSGAGAPGATAPEKNLKLQVLFKRNKKGLKT